MGFVYPDLDLSKINIDDTMLQMPGGDDIINDDPDDSSHTVKQVVKDDSVVIAQPALEDVVAPVV